MTRGGRIAIWGVDIIHLVRYAEGVGDENES